jgi:methyltransferase family protein
MVNIHHHHPPKQVDDQAALAVFQQQWQTYQKLVDGNYLSHREVYGILHQVLVGNFAHRPFNFLELACGDAGSTAEALMGTTIQHYHGLDLSEPALEMARRNLEKLPCPVELEEGDFIAAMRGRPEAADVVWLGLSLHHLDPAGKRELMGEVHNMIGDQGLFLVYEPILLPGESRDAYMERVEGTHRPLWKSLTTQELDTLFEHIKGYDFPESSQTWKAMALDQGFSRAQELFVNPTRFLSMFCFHA